MLPQDCSSPQREFSFEELRMMCKVRRRRVPPGYPAGCVRGPPAAWGDAGQAVIPL